MHTKRLVVHEPLSKRSPSAATSYSFVCPLYTRFSSFLEIGWLETKIVWILQTATQNCAHEYDFI